MSKNDYQQLHDEAVAKGLKYYIDPLTGYRVTTALGHRQRGECCGCGCRHCPFGEDEEKGAATAAAPVQKDN